MKEKKRVSFELGDREGTGRWVGRRGEGTAGAEAVRWGRARCFSGSEKGGQCCGKKEKEEVVPFGAESRLWGGLQGALWGFVVGVVGGLGRGF